LSARSFSGPGKTSLVLLSILALAALLYWWWRSAPKLVAKSQQIEASTPLHVAAAADLSPTLNDLNAEFKRRTCVEVPVTLGASGTLYSQIVNGAPFDVFLSADSGYPRNLAQQGYVRGEVKDYALGHIVLWFRRDLLNHAKAAPELLESDQVRRIAIANPEHAPYGRAAVAALKSLRVYEQVQKKLVLGESVSQATQFAVSGNVDAAVLPLTTVKSPQIRDKGRYWPIPQQDYPGILQSAALLSSSTHKAGPPYLDFLLSPEGQAILRRHGFSPTVEVQP
jgi:molybdate transport system substrate-binding protein